MGQSRSITRKRAARCRGDKRTDQIAVAIGASNVEHPAASRANLGSGIRRLRYLKPLKLGPQPFAANPENLSGMGAVSTSVLQHRID